MGYTMCILFSKEAIAICLTLIGGNLMPNKSELNNAIVTFIIDMK
jgi:hypothetical protein